MSSTEPRMYCVGALLEAHRSRLQKPLSSMRNYACGFVRICGFSWEEGLLLSSLSLKGFQSLDESKITL